MAIFTESYINEYFLQKDPEALMEGVSFKEISGLEQLTTKLVNFGKSVAAKFNKNACITEENLQREIDNLDKIIKDIDDELEEAKDPNYKISFKTVAKYFAGFFVEYTIGFIASTLVVIPTGVTIIGAGRATEYLKMAVQNKSTTRLARSVHKRYTINEIKSFVKGYTKFISIISAAMSVAYSGIKTATFLNDYKRSLIDWKDKLKETKKDLQNKLEEAKKSTK